MEYGRLNAAQKQAVDAIDGPVLIVAGPGTGKTQLLSARVANILQKSDVYPDNILCLTFTNKAADNMKERLRELIGNDASSIVVRTFHGLAAHVMNRYPEYFWHGAKLSIAADAVQLEIIQRVLGSLPPDNPLSLKFAGQFTLIDDVSRSINLAKEAGLTPDKLRAIISANIEYIDQIEASMVELGNLRISGKSLDKIEGIVESLPDQPIEKLITPLLSLKTVIQQSFENAKTEAEKIGKNTPFSKWKSRWIQKNDGSYGMFDERARNNWWNALADAYELYRNQLHLRGFYDYADMLVEVIGQIEQNSDLRASLQEQFQYVLIDEFQDTNAAQLRLAHLIADHQELDQPNLMAVGDDDQSIFKFQGAELSNMLGFTRQYPASKIVILTDNYRSTQVVLDAADGIIKHARYRLVGHMENLSKDLKAVNPPKNKGALGHKIYRSREEQLNDLALLAGQLLEKGSVAILARHHASLRDISALLNRNHVPLSYEQSNDILQQPAIEQLFLILKILVATKKGNRSSVNEALSLALRHPMWGIEPKTLWTFALDQQTKHDWLSGLRLTSDKKLNKVGEWLEWLTGLSASEPLAVVIEYVLGLRDNDLLESPIKTYYLQSDKISDTYVGTLSALHVLRTLVGEFSASRTTKVEDFVQFVELMAGNNKVIADTSPFVSGTKCVELMTVHKAKGLEFDAVIIVDGTEQEWSPRVRGRIPPANLPLRPAEDDTDDYARLMYVAATRAKHTLIVGSYKLSVKNEDMASAASLSEFPKIDVRPLEGKELVTALEQSLLWPKLEQIDERELLLPRLKNFSINVSNLINFLDLSRGGPAYFKERSLLRLPQAKSPSAAMGTAIHSALEEAQLAANAGVSDIEVVLNKFKTALKNEGLPEQDYKKKLAEGERALKLFIQKWEWQFTPGAHPEYKVADVFCDQARLDGKLDVLDRTNGHALITDYKTGKPLNSLNVRAGEQGIKAWRHRLQLIFYALLVDIDPGIKVKGDSVCQMVYVESGSKNKLVLSYQPTKNELTRLGSLINAVWRHIQKLDFPDVDHYPPTADGIHKFEEDLLEGKI